MTEWNPNSKIGYFFGAYGFILSTFALLITARFIYHLVTIKSKTSALIRKLSIIGVIIACIDMYGLTWWNCHIHVDPHFYFKYWYLGIPIRMLYFLSLLSIITIAIVRISITLNSTAYQYPRIVYTIFWIFFILGASSGFIGTIGDIFFEYKQTIIFGITGLIIYIFTTLYSISLFFHTLQNIANKLDGKEQLKHKAQLFKLMTKYAILVIVPSLTALLTAIATALSVLIDKYSELAGVAYFVAILSDLLVNIISLSLQFDFNEEKYFKFCSKCHNAAVNILLKSKENVMTKDNHVTLKRIVTTATLEIEIATAAYSETAN